MITTTTSKEPAADLTTISPASPSGLIPKSLRSPSKDIQEAEEVAAAISNSITHIKMITWIILLVRGSIQDLIVTSTKGHFKATRTIRRRLVDFPEVEADTSKCPKVTKISTGIIQVVARTINSIHTRRVAKRT